MRFFAFAGNEQMPIRKLAVNWGDAAPGAGDNFISGDPSFYRNQRGATNGVCKLDQYSGSRDTKRCFLPKVFVDDTVGSLSQGTETPGFANPVLYFQSTCKSDSDCQQFDICQPRGNGIQTASQDQSEWFGIRRDKTCNSGFFEFKDHEYACDKIVNADYYKNPNECPGGAGAYPGGCCMYQPKVFVQDNWGWCTGNCTKDINGKDAGCFGGVGSATQQCLDENSLPQSKAWQTFGGVDGKVIIPAE